MLRISVEDVRLDPEQGPSGPHSIHAAGSETQPGSGTTRKSGETGLQIVDGHHRSWRADADVGTGSVEQCSNMLKPVRITTSIPVPGVVDSCVRTADDAPYGSA